MKDTSATAVHTMGDTQTYEAVAAKVLEIEAEALASLSRNLPADFSRVVDAILKARGRVVLSGIGKSGHVARKIAATLASTGTPAFYVHPAEASHGDLGMITSEDVCVLLSNSGETAELRDLIAHGARYGIVLIGMSRKEASALMRAATFKLTLPDLPEACSIGMAPTTSTTLMMGLGDALAVALMEARKFKEDAFRAFHPGGTLGAQLAQVQQIMHGPQSLPLVESETPMPDVILCMTSGGFGVAGVCDSTGKLVGVVSDGDLRRNMDGLLEHTAGAICSRIPVFVEPETLAAEALSIMNARKVSVLFVCREGKPIGVLHVHDLLRIGVM